MGKQVRDKKPMTDEECTRREEWWEKWNRETPVILPEDADLIARAKIRLFEGMAEYDRLHPRESK